IQNDQRRTAAASTDLFVPRQRYDRLRRTGSAKHNVGGRECIIEALPGDDPSAAAFRDFRRLFRAPIGDANLARPELFQMTKRELAHFAGTNDEDGLIVKVV